METKQGNAAPLVHFTCPHCAAALPVDGRPCVVCPYCESVVGIPEEYRRLLSPKEQPEKEKQPVQQPQDVRMRTNTEPKLTTDQKIERFLRKRGIPEILCSLFGVVIGLITGLFHAIFGLVIFSAIRRLFFLVRRVFWCALVVFVILLVLILIL